MARSDFTSPRLFIEAPLREGARLMLGPEQTNYLVNVLRLREGARVLVFNGRDGEFATSSRHRSRARARARRRRAFAGTGIRRPTSTISSRRSNTRGSIIWRRRR